MIPVNENMHNHWHYKVVLRDTILKNGECEYRSRSERNIFELATTENVHFDKRVRWKAIYLCKRCKQFDLTTAIL